MQEKFTAQLIVPPGYLESSETGLVFWFFLLVCFFVVFFFLFVYLFGFFVTVYFVFCCFCGCFCLFV